MPRVHAKIGQHSCRAVARIAQQDICYSRQRVLRCWTAYGARRTLSGNSKAVPVFLGGRKIEQKLAFACDKKRRLATIPENESGGDTKSQEPNKRTVRVRKINQVRAGVPLPPLWCAFPSGLAGSVVSFPLFVAHPLFIARV